LIDETDAYALFVERFGGTPDVVVRVPGRVNLIGEHTDYNDGFVLPMAIERATWVAVRPRRDRTVRIASAEHPDVSFDLDHLSRGGDDWAEYVEGIAWALGADALGGWDGAFVSDIPIGAGLSSSAALEIAAAVAFTVSSDGSWDPVGAAIAAQRCENDWMGVGSGIMDQLIVATAEAGHATLIDCRTLELSPTPLPQNVSVVILDTGTRRELVGSAYDDRRDACERAAAAAGVPALRDLDVTDLPRLAAAVDDTTFRRARHVVTENARTLEAAGALENGDAVRFGELMAASHRSLRDDFAVSSPALDIMVEIAAADAACFGARMTGAGFGGCAVALVTAEDAPSFAARIADHYAEATDHEPRVYVTGAAPGPGIIEMEDVTP
jgi:galactokinase